jgi:hypothetical protein
MVRAFRCSSFLPRRGKTAWITGDRFIVFSAKTVTDVSRAKMYLNSRALLTWISFGVNSHFLSLTSTTWGRSAGLRNARVGLS